MLQENFGNIVIYGSIFAFILCTVIMVIKKGEVNLIMLSSGMFLACVLIPVVLYCGYYGMSERAHQKEGTPLIKISSVNFVFSNVSGDPDYTYYNKDPKTSFGFPDDWYDEDGELGRNIDFEILSRTQVEISFYDLDSDLCRSIQRSARMYNGKVLDRRSCDDRGSVSVLFGS